MPLTAGRLWTITCGQINLSGRLESHQRSFWTETLLSLSVFFTVQLSHPYMTTGKTIALTRWTFVGKVMSLLFNMLSRLVVTFLTRSKRLLISWLQSPSAVILEPKEIKSDTVSTVSPSISHEVMGSDAMILVFWMLSFKPNFSLSSFARVQPWWIQGNSKQWQRGEEKLIYLEIWKKLRRNSIVGKFSGEKRLNNLVYVEN